VNTGSLRKRAVLTTLPLLAVVLVAVVTVVTLLYRSSLDSDLRHRLAAAASVMRQAWPAGQGKQVAFSLALQGVATDIRAGPLNAGGAPANTPSGSDAAQRGSLLVMRQTLPDGTQITYSASEQETQSAVRRLLVIEAAVSLAALAVMALLLLRATTTALQPLTQVAQTALRISSGDRSQRLRPGRTDTELGSMAEAFDQMVDALDAAIARAERAEAGMRTFLADASHELRTPVAGPAGNRRNTPPRAARTARTRRDRSIPGPRRRAPWPARRRPPGTRASRDAPAICSRRSGRGHPAGSRPGSRPRPQHPGHATPLPAAGNPRRYRRPQPPVPEPARQRARRRPASRRGREHLSPTHE
jgi:two-component system, OmpR family, sensor kinase